MSLFHHSSKIAYLNTFNGWIYLRSWCINVCDWAPMHYSVCVYWWIYLFRVVLDFNHFALPPLMILPQYVILVERLGRRRYKLFSSRVKQYLFWLIAYMWIHVEGSCINSWKSNCKCCWYEHPCQVLSHWCVSKWYFSALLIFFFLFCFFMCLNFLHVAVIYHIFHWRTFMNELTRS